MSQANERAGASSNPAQRLQAIGSHPDYASQWHQLSPDMWRRATPEEAQALVDFAADPQSSGSLLVRMRALDTGLWALNWAHQSGIKLDERQRATYDHAQALLGELFDGSTHATNSTHPGHQADPRYRAGHYATMQLAGAEGIDPSIFYPPRDDGYDDTGHINRTQLPVAAMLLADRLIGLPSQPATRYLPPSLCRDVAALALDFGSEAYTRALHDPTGNVVASFARLARLTQAGGYEHDSPIDALYAARTPEVIECVEALNRFYDTVPRLREMFPISDPELLDQGVRRLVANGLFALQLYAERGRIEGAFNSSDGIQRTIDECAPLEVIESSIRAIELAAEAVASPSSLPVFGPGTAWFHHCVFQDLASGAHPVVSYHGRPFKSEGLDTRYEFSRSSTSRYRVQLNTDAPIAHANADQTADTVCIRIDYGRNGLALDLGAIRDNPYVAHPDDMDVRVGRLFGFGNYLRSLMQDEDPTMHHVHSIRAAYGTNEEFSEYILTHGQTLRAKAEALLTSLSTSS